MKSYTFRELHGLVRRMAAALRANGLQVGDRVAGTSTPSWSSVLLFNALRIAIVTNSIHAVVICLAVASVGGVFSSTATDMGTQVCAVANFSLLELCLRQ